VAAGRGTRVGGDTPKQFHLIAGVPMVLRALRPFASHPDVAVVVLVLPADAASAPPEFLRSVGSGLTIVPGGPVRADSVALGLAALGRDCTIVLVHDAARPFVERAVIDAVIAHARAGEGGVAAIRLSDTLKQAATDDPSTLGPQDIVFVPYTPYRVLNRYVDLILDTFVRTIGVNEGARAVSDRAVPVSVNVPLGSL